MKSTVLGAVAVAAAGLLCSSAQAEQTFQNYDAGVTYTSNDFVDISQAEVGAEVGYRFGQVHLEFAATLASVDFGTGDLSFTGASMLLGYQITPALAVWLAGYSFGIDSDFQEPDFTLFLEYQREAFGFGLARPDPLGTEIWTPRVDIYGWADLTPALGLSGLADLQSDGASLFLTGTYMTPRSEHMLGLGLSRYDRFSSDNIAMRSQFDLCDWLATGFGLSAGRSGSGTSTSTNVGATIFAEYRMTDTTRITAVIGNQRFDSNSAPAQTQRSFQLWFAFDMGRSGRAYDRVIDDQERLFIFQYGAAGRIG